MLTTRRQVLKSVASTVLASGLLSRLALRAEVPLVAPVSAPAPSGPFTLPALPYAYDALEPAIDAATMRLHHDKHHLAYVTKLNEASAKEPALAQLGSVDAILKDLSEVPESVRTLVRNNGGGHSNHTLFWETLGPKQGGEPAGELGKALRAGWGGFPAFQEAVIKAGTSVFGSGWVWLVLDSSKKLAVISLPNQDSPFSSGQYPVFGIDVWEHAYYLKYHNVRPAYLKAIWSVLNWDAIAARYAKGLQS